LQEAEVWDGEEMVPLPVDSETLASMMDMGFSDVRSRKAIHHGSTLEGAIAWITEHQEDPDIDQPYMVRKRDTIPKVPLTAEEKAAKIAAAQEKIKQMRLAKQKKEKEDEIMREKERRSRGQKSQETDEAREKMVRQMEAKKAKKEKEDSIKERERLRAEIAADKAARAANKGVLPSVLGVGGYNPSAVQYDADAKPTPGALPTTAAPTTTTIKPTAASVAVKSGGSGSSIIADPVKAVDMAIETLCKYRTGCDGGQAMKLLITFLKNIADSPEEPKFKSINTESKAYSGKLAPLVGPLQLLKAVGFEKNSENKLVLNDR
jgi:UBX domain-containing protein 1/4